MSCYKLSNLSPFCLVLFVGSNPHALQSSSSRNCYKQAPKIPRKERSFSQCRSWKGHPCWPWAGGSSCGITARRGRSVDVEVKGVILVDLELGWHGLRGFSQVIAVQHMVFAGAVPLHLHLPVLLMTQPEHQVQHRTLKTVCTAKKGRWCQLTNLLLHCQWLTLVYLQNKAQAGQKANFSTLTQ